MESNIACTILRDEEQKLTLKLENQEAGVTIIETLIYAKYT